MGKSTNKKNIVIMVVACICCSAVALMVGYAMPHAVTGDRDGQSKQDAVDAKYAGLYISGENKLYLYKDGTCPVGSEGAKTNHFQTCTWRVEGKKLIEHHTGITHTFCETREECEEYINTYHADFERYIEELREDDKDYLNDPRLGIQFYAVCSDYDKKYDILDDGSLMDDYHNYVKRSSL